MRMIVVAFIALITFQAQAQTYEMTCNYQYESYTSLTPEVRSFTLSADQDSLGITQFNTNIQDLPAYFFPSDRYGSFWHFDSSIYFTAHLEKNNLRYSFIFNNHIDDYDKISTVFNETRNLALPLHFKRHGFQFNYNDGIAVYAVINNDDFVNSRHIQINDCNISQIY